MIIEAFTKTETNCNLTNKEFDIKASPIAFDILSSKLYSDNILAIVRELLTNAYDSQVKNGNPDTPIYVKLPNYTEREFIIRDYGTGLSKKDILNIYTTFFNSTKSNSNDFTGCFGLGSKTPFSYTTSFSIISYFNKKAYYYVAVKKDGYPSIYILKEEDTTEPNGLKIIIPVNDDYAKFNIALKNYRKWIPEIILNCSNPIYNYAEKPLIKLSDTCSFYQQEESRYLTISSLYIKQGQNIYKVDSNKVKNLSCPTYGIVVKEVPIGTFNITPSRESLIEDDNLFNKIEIYKKEIEENFKQLIENDNELTYIGFSWSSELYKEKYNKKFNSELLIKMNPKDFTINIKDFIYNSYSFIIQSTNTSYNVYSSNRLEYNKNYYVVIFKKYSSTFINKLKKWACETNNNLIVLSLYAKNTKYYEIIKDTIKAYKQLEQIKEFGITFNYYSYKEIAKNFKSIDKKLKSEDSINTIDKEINITANIATLVFKKDSTYRSGRFNVYEIGNIIKTVNSIHSSYKPDNSFIFSLSKDNNYKLFDLFFGLLHIKDTNKNYFFRDYLSKKYKIPMDFFNQDTLNLVKITKTNKKYFKDYYIIDLYNDIIEMLKIDNWKIFINYHCTIPHKKIVDKFINTYFTENQCNIVINSYLYKAYTSLFNLIDKNNYYTDIVEFLNSYRILNIINTLSIKHDIHSVHTTKSIEDYCLKIYSDNKYKYLNDFLRFLSKSENFYKMDIKTEELIQLNPNLSIYKNFTPRKVALKLLEYIHKRRTNVLFY